MTETTQHEDLTVGRVAELVGVSVRTLHHWDAIGLVRPGGRSWAGYRLYDAGTGPIHRVLGTSWSGARGDRADPMILRRSSRALRCQKDLSPSGSAARGTARAVDDDRETDMTARNSTPLSPEEQARIFRHRLGPAYQEEARERWGAPTPGSSPPPQRRPRCWQWQEIKDELDEVRPRRRRPTGASTRQRGGERARERHRATITRHYDCTHAMQVVLARMYTEDPRFAAHYDQRAEGLAAWLRHAIEENARAHGVDPETATWQ